MEFRQWLNEIAPVHGVDIAPEEPHQYYVQKHPSQPPQHGQTQFHQRVQEIRNIKNHLEDLQNQIEESFETSYPDKREASEDLVRRLVEDLLARVNNDQTGVMQKTIRPHLDSFMMYFNGFMKALEKPHSPEAKAIDPKGAVQYLRISLENAMEALKKDAAFQFVDSL